MPWFYICVFRVVSLYPIGRTEEGRAPRMWKATRTIKRLAGSDIQGEQPPTRPVLSVSETRRRERGRPVASPWKRKLRKTRANRSVGERLCF